MSSSLFDGRYEIVRRLGGGGMAVVYLARDGHLGRDVALKVLKDRLAGDEDFLKRFRREARSAAALNHPNVVQVYDQRRSEDGRYYIAMEYVPRGTLKERIAREGPLDPAETARLGAQVAEALRVAHARGVVHRDVKSQNVLLDAAGDAKVADFGIARAADATTVSGPGTVLGTARYMSPEQATGEIATPRSDLYSLGVVLYEMLTGELPFKAENPAQARAEHAAMPSPRPGDANPAVPEEMDALVTSLMARDPERRPGSAAELVDELRRMRDRLADSGGRADQHRTRTLPAPRTVDPKPRRRWPLRLLVALVALLAVLGALAWGLGTQAVGGDLAGRARGVFEDAGRVLFGPEEVSVPDVEGLDRSEARLRLSEAGLGARIRPRQSPESKVGTVLEQSVPGGKRVEEGSKILLAVGEGSPSAGTPREKTMAGNEGVPDLVGLSYPEAEGILRSAGYALGGVTEVPSETVPAGVIVEQDPRAGSPASPGTPVYLTTSTGRTATSATASASASAIGTPSAPASAAPP